MDDLKKHTVPALPERLLLDLRTECNLNCPMCLLHGDIRELDADKKEAAIGKMELEQATSLLDEIMSARPLIQPSMWGEPLLAKDLKEHIKGMKDRGIAVCFNTNGLTLREHHVEFFVENKLDSMFFSLDSTTPETLKLVRGVDKLAKIEKNVMMALEVRERMQSDLPRIGVSFTTQEANKHELEEFIDKWVGVVDAVRVGNVFEAGSLKYVEEQNVRTPCAALYHTMPIHYNGDASICCFDSFGTEIVGNVFKDQKNQALPSKSKLDQTRSDIVGDFYYKLEDKFELNYNFSYDRDLKFSNYDAITAKLGANKLVTTFDYITENHELGNSELLKNNTEVKFSNEHSLKFDTTKDLKDDFTQFYKLAYKYETDCLSASFEYEKKFFRDGSLMPDESLYFLIRFIPFAELRGSADTIFD